MWTEEGMQVIAAHQILCFALGVHMGTLKKCAHELTKSSASQIAS
jgi:hypothetical protein